MTFCNQCGREVLPGSDFCPYCGTRTAATNNNINNVIPQSQAAAPQASPVYPPNQNAYQHPYQNPYQNQYQGYTINNIPTAPYPVRHSTPVAGIILGILGIIFAWLFALAGHILSIIGIVVGVREMREHNSRAGLVLSIIGEVCSIASSVLGVILATGIYGFAASAM